MEMWLCMEACVYCEQNTTVTVRNSTFMNNTARMGGAVFCQNMLKPDKIKINRDEQAVKMYALKDFNHSRKISFNKIAEDTVTHNGGQKVTSKFFIYNSSFINNVANMKGGALCIEGSFVDLYLNNCHMTSNTATDTGGDIYVKGIKGLTIQTFVHNCDFGDASTAIGGGNIYIENAFLHVLNSHFQGASLYEGGNIEATKNSTVDIHNSSFSRSFSVVGYMYLAESVILNIADSVFSCLIMENLSYIDAVNNCSITVIRSHFTINQTLPSFVKVFNIESNTHLTVQDSLFEANLGFGLYIISVSQNCQVTFSNSSFNKVSGFMISHNTNVYIKDSRIVGCINTLQTDALIEIWFTSHLFISGSNITNNSILPTSRLLSVHTDSSLTLTNCLYANNIMTSHLVALNNTSINISNCYIANNSVVDHDDTDMKGIIVTSNSSVIISKCQFFQNVLKTHTFSQMLQFSEGHILVLASSFRHNSGDAVNTPVVLLISINSTHTAKFANCKFLVNLVPTVIRAASRSTNLNVNLQLNNCSFHL